MPAPVPGAVEARLRAHGLQLPPGHTLTTLTERPELEPLVDAHHAGLWEPFMSESEIANRKFPRATTCAERPRSIFGPARPGRRAIRLWLDGAVSSIVVVKERSP